MRALPACSLALLAAAAGAQQRVAAPVVAGDLGKRLDALVRDQAPAFWGAVLVASEGRPVLAKGYGMADRARTPNGPQSLFDLGGTSQVLTSILALRLCAEHTWRLADPVHKHLPEWPADKASITIEHLLRHTSGLPAEASWSGGAANASRTAIDAIGRTELIAPPGAGVHYSSLNATVLALAAEAVLQGRYDKLLAERVLKPFGMHGAGPCNGRFEGRLVTARRGKDDERGRPATEFDLNWAHRGARGVLASVADVHALLLGLAEGKLLDAVARDLLVQPIAGGDAFAVSRVPFGGATMVRVAGAASGYRARWLVHDATRCWIVLLTEDFGSTGELETSLLGELAQHAQALIAASAAPAAAGPAAPAQPPTPAPAPAAAPAAPVPPPAPPPTAAPSSGEAAALDRFVGTFVLPRGGGTLRIERDGAQLRLSGSGLHASVRVAEGWSGDREARRRLAEDRGLSIVEHLARGAEAEATAAFAAPEPAAAALRACAGWLTQHGPLQRVEFVGTQFVGETAHSWFVVHGATGALPLQATWHDERQFGSCRVPADAAPFTVPIRLLRADCAVGKALAGGELRLTVEGSGPCRVLVFEDGTPGADGLLDCPLVENRPR